MRPSPESASRAGPAGEGGDLTVALAYPSTRGVAEASLGFQIVARQLNAIPGVLALRTFLPAGPGRTRGALLTTDHPREVARCDWLAFSVSYENDYLNVLAIMAAAGIPLEWRERGEEHPLVVVGGIAPSLNPEPLAAAADLFVIGEAEEALPQLVAAYREARDAGARREELLLALARIPGVYVPRFYEAAWGEDGMLASFSPVADVQPKVRRLWVADLDRWRADGEAPEDESGLGSMVLLEVGRGCGRGCRFCAAGFFYRPVRHRSFASLLPVMERRIAEGARLGLLGASVFDHPDIGRMAAWLEERGCPFSVSSLRADALDPGVLRAMAAGGLKTVTIAPETGTERLRAAMGKRMSDEDILGASEAIARSGIPNVKLYFMIGLPGETREDVSGIVELVKGVRHRILTVARGLGRMGSIMVSVSCYVPKAWTPFQWHPMEDVASLKEKQRLLARALAKVPNVRATHDLPQWAFIQALLSRGDRRVFGALRLAHELGGDWKQALRRSPVNAGFHVNRTRDQGELFPWDFIDTGISRAYLWKEYQASL